MYARKKRPQLVSWRGFKIAVANATDTLNIKTAENCRSMNFLVSFSQSCLLFWSPACHTRTWDLFEYFMLIGVLVSRGILFTYDKGGGKCVCPRSFVCLSVCLSVSKITQKGVHGFV